VEVLVGEEGEGEEGGFFYAEEEGGPCEHDWFIRVFGRVGSCRATRSIGREIWRVLRFLRAYDKTTAL
jgi:hypothetical protein